MQKLSNEDNESIHSHDSTASVVPSTPEEKLTSLINMELKHSAVYYELLSKNNLLKMDLENLSSSSEKFEAQKKTKNELLQKRFDELKDIQKRNKNEMDKKLSQVRQTMKAHDDLFLEAHNKYSSESLKDSIDDLEGRLQSLEKKLEEKKNDFESVKQEINAILMKPKSTNKSDIGNIINSVFKISTKRSEKEIKQNITKLNHEIQELEKKKLDLQSWVEQSR